MSNAVLDVTAHGLDEAILAIEGIADAPRQELMEGIARLVQEQTRTRIEEEKTAPDGAAWKPNRAGTSTLYQSGDLSASIDYRATETSALVGSGLIYARIHQDGGVIKAKNAKALAFQIGNRLVMTNSVTIPRRQYLGLSADNQRDIIEAAEDWVGRLLQ
ncbi:phage virion morphogenesis protein [Nitratireductor aquimarinus]|uniref:phage virion morphogenesis protein n=1 Tax=Nitratireductor aquimarinus TaxID=889300 RepID=UPI001A8C374C|nr:phage virion morphogenesis protein [Nitratireductor aquimarinus]MBN8243306.1 phage virion morphogenesis protein [Nitratireductor aquimarinus]MBY6131207.1 phage virion morphogenesis protein [Nitratireductor aquimarinus]MCA1302037.1 phage virion morphogenesis protein [Nitratireductor aquimarinus]